MKQLWIRPAACALLLAVIFLAGAAPPPTVSWTVQKSGTDAGLRGVSAVDEMIAWASGSKGTVLRTMDGGNTWTRAKVPGAESLDFRDIEAFGADAAMVLAIGRPSKIFKTEDGGKTWTEPYSNDAPGIFLDAFAFFDEQEGIALGDAMDGRFVLLSTSFRGQLWRFLPEACRPAAEQGEGAFAASGTCISVRPGGEVWFCTGGTVSRLFHSRDWGKTWEIAPSPLLSGQASFGAYSIAFLDDKTGLIVGGDYRNEKASDKNAAWTGDGGKIWTLVVEGRPAGFRECVAFAPGTAPRLAVAVGPSGSDLSADLGKTWTPIAGPEGFHSLSFAAAGKAGWAVGKNGLIAKLAY